MRNKSEITCPRCQEIVEIHIGFQYFRQGKIPIRHVIAVAKCLKCGISAEISLRPEQKECLQPEILNQHLSEQLRQKIILSILNQLTGGQNKKGT